MPELQALLIAIAALTASQAAPPPAERPADPARPAPAVETTESEGFRAATRALPRAARAAQIKNRGEIANFQDYPKAALDEAMQGRTVVQLLVNSDGRIGGCWVSKSSGHPVLDAQTCDIVVANALFEPARDRRGRAVPGLAPLAMTWRLEGGKPTVPANSIAKMTTVVGPEGQVRSCKFQIFFDKAWRDGPAEICAAKGAMPADYWLAIRKGSKLHDAVVVEELRGLTDLTQPIPEIAEGKGDVLVILKSARMSFAPDGKRMSCTTLEDVGTDRRFVPLCDQRREGSFKVPPEVLRKSGATDVRAVEAIYLTGEPE